MKITKRKRAVPAKRRSAVPAKQEHRTPSHATASEDRTGHWTQRIEPSDAAIVTKMLGPIYFVIKNRGHESVFLMAENGDLMELGPGRVRVTYAAGTILGQIAVKSRF